MPRRLLESLSGIGAIHAGDVLVRMTQYELSVWSDEATRPSGDDPKSVSIDGHIDVTDIAEATVLSGIDTVTLTVEDGRRLAFQLTSSGGGIVSKGWLP